MPAVAYAPSDHVAGHISRPSHAGGCGQQHEITLDASGRPHIECDRCAPSLISGHYGWASRPGDVPLTPDEIADQELAERDAKGARNTLLKGMTEAFMKAMQGGTVFGEQAKPKSLLEQISEMTPEEKAALASILHPPAAPGGGGAYVSESPDGGAKLLTQDPPKTARVPRSSASKPRAAR